MSGNADRSLTYRIQLASNRTKQWYKLQLEEEKRRHEDNVQRPILADPSEELPLLQRLGSLAVYRDGVLYLPSPALGLVEITPVEPSPVIPLDLISWIMNIDISGYDTSSILSTGANNDYYYARYYSYSGTSSSITLYDTSGTVLSSFGPNTASNSYSSSALYFVGKDVSGIISYWFNGMDTDLSNVPTIGFNNSVILPRSAVSTGGRFYQIVPYGNPSYVTGATNLIISKDTSGNIVASIPQDVSGHYDSAVIAFDASGGYLFNNSFRTADLSDNIPNFNIQLSSIGTTSDEGYIVAGNFNTQQVRMYDSSGEGGDYTQLTVNPRRLQSGTSRSSDTFTASYDSNGALRFYNYIRGDDNANSFLPGVSISDIDIKGNDEYAIVGTYILGTRVPGTSRKLEFYTKNSTSVIAYDTSGFRVAPSSLASTGKNIFIAKYSSTGDLQWTALSFFNTTTNIDDESYNVKNLENGVVFQGLFGGSKGSALIVYQGKTPAQQDTSGVQFTTMSLDISNSNYNPFIVRYDNNGTILWSKLYQGMYGAQPFSSVNQAAIPLLIDTSDNIYTASSWMYDLSNTLALRSYRPTQTVNFTLTHSGSGRNTVITSIGTDVSGTPNWYAHIRNVSTADQSGNYILNAALLSDNSQVYLIRYYSPLEVLVYNNDISGVRNTHSIPKTGTNYSIPAFAILKINQSGTLLSYVRSASTYAFDINNSLSVDTSNNIYITGNLYSASPVVGQTASFVNQDGDVVATFVKRTNKQNEAFNLKILPSFTSAPPTPPTTVNSWVVNYCISGNIFAFGSRSVYTNPYIFRNILFGNNPANNTYLRFYNKDGTLIYTSVPINNQLIVQEYVNFFLYPDGTDVLIYKYDTGILLTNSLLGTLYDSSVSPRINVSTPTMLYNVFSFIGLNSPYNYVSIKNRENTEFAQMKIAQSYVSNTGIIYYTKDGVFDNKLVSLRNLDISSSLGAPAVRFSTTNAFSDESVIIGGTFTANAFAMYNINDVSMAQITVPVAKTPANSDAYIAAFNKDGSFKFYNYIRGENITNGNANEGIVYIEVDDSDNYYAAGVFDNISTVAPGNRIQIYNKNTSGPSGTVVFDTSGFTTGLALNNLNTLNITSSFYQNFIAKFNSTGDFQWFAPTYSNLGDTSTDCTYMVKKHTDGIVSTMWFSTTASSPPNNTLTIYNGRTAAQGDASGSIFTRVSLANFGTSNINSLIIKYNSNGIVQWVKAIQSTFVSPIGTNRVTLPIIIDTSNNIYSAATLNNTVFFRDWAPNDISNTLLSVPVGTNGVPNGFLYSLDQNGNLRWYGVLQNLSASGSIITSFNSITTNNEVIYVGRFNVNCRLVLYNPSGTIINSAYINIPQGGITTVDRLFIIKISNDGSNIKFIRSTNGSVVNSGALFINNDIELDNQNNMYLTLNNGSIPAGGTIQFVNQNNEVVTTYTRRENLFTELMTIKIPASFTAY